METDDLLITSKKKLLLIIEDDDINRELLSALLEDDYDTLQAANGKEGLELLSAYADKVSLILLDLNMPVMNGYEFLNVVSQDENYRSIPIIVTTSSKSMEEEISTLKQGASDFVAKPYNREIILNRINAIIRLRESVSLVELFKYDKLTNVYSREYFYKMVSELISGENSDDYDIILTNIEAFKIINARHGTKAGDECLAKFAAILSGFLEEGDICGRVNGDRFGILCRSKSHEIYKEKIAEIKTRVEESMPFPVTVRFGIVTQVDGDTEPSVLFDMATIALTRIYGKYDAYVSFFDDETRKTAEMEQIITDSMENAIKNFEFELYYQPKHDMAGDVTAGAEALVRWHHPELGFLTPGRFIGVFEKNSFIDKLDAYVWEAACRFIGKKLAANEQIVPISVNISRTDFDCPDLDKLFINLTQTYGVPRNYLHLEVTESAYYDNTVQFESCLRKLKEAGFTIELDDFGSGYSNFAMLGSVPLDVLKIDQSLVRASANPRVRILLSQIAEMADKLGMDTVVEGCETLEIAHDMHKLGFRCVQGYCFSRPLCEADFMNYLRENG